MDVLHDIQELLVEKFDVKRELVTADATLQDLGLDSLSIAELVFDLAEKYDIDIPDDNATFNTVGEAAALVDQLIAAKSA